MAAEFPASELETAARAVIEQAGSALAARRSDIPASFVAQLYGRAVADDVLHYAAPDLADLAERAFDFLKDRQPGAPKIRCETVALNESGERKTVSVIEIVNDDMPFLVDSVMGEIGERRLNVLLVAHPVFGVRRDGAKLAAFGADAAGGARESFIHIHLEPIAEAAARGDLVRALESVLGEVRLAVQDWRAMLERANGIVADLKTNPPPLPVDEIAEAVQFLQWLLADNFTFLGVRNYTFDGNTLEPDFDSALGIMRSPELRVLKRGEELLEYTPEIMAFLREPRLLIIAKANIHARVHRRVYLDYIGIKRFDASGNLVGEQRIVGLFTSTAYTRSAHSIPYLRRKIAGVEARAGFDPSSHSGKALANVLEHYPRDELFQIEEDSLYHFALAILQLDERPRVRVLARRDRFDRFVSVLVYVPRERYDSDIRARIGDYLSRAFIGRVSAFYPFFPEGPLVRVHFIIGRSGGHAPAVDGATLEREVAAIVRSWTDGLGDALALLNPPDKAHELFDRYRDAFSQGFQEFYAPTVAASDIRTVEALSEARPLAVELRHRNEEEQRNASLKVWSYGRPLPLSERVPVLENMGFKVVDERTYRITPQGAAGFWLHDMLLERHGGGMIDLDPGKARLEAAFLMVMRGAAENDGYNALTLAGGLGWRDVALIRTLSRFLRQVRVPFSQDYMWATLVKHAGIAGNIVELFHARFDPRPEAAQDRDGKQKAIAGAHRGGIAEGREPGRGPHPAPFRQRGAVGDPHQFLPARQRRPPQGDDRDQVRKRQDHRSAAAAPALRDLRLFAARGRRAHALRQGGARRHPLVRPAAGFPHRDSRAGEGAAGQERRDRAGRRQGRLRAQADAEKSDPRTVPGGRRRHLQIVHLDAARHHRQHPSRRHDRSARLRGAARGRRSLSGGGGRQGHRDLLRHRQRDFDRARLLAGRRLRLRRFGRLRPQGHGHHRARRLGGGEAALPRDGRRYRQDAVFRRRRRRHVGRRVRQRHAARKHHAAAGGLRSPRHLHRSRSRTGGGLRRAQAAVRAAALELAGLRQETDLGRRRRLSALLEGNPLEPGGAETVRRRRKP